MAGDHFILINISEGGQRRDGQKSPKQRTLFSRRLCLIVIVTAIFTYIVSVCAVLSVNLLQPNSLCEESIQKLKQLRDNTSKLMDGNTNTLITQIKASEQTCKAKVEESAKEAAHNVTDVIDTKMDRFVLNVLKL